MANDPKLKQVSEFLGTLDQDTSLEKVEPNNYVAAKNVRALTDNTESTMAHIPMLGNEQVFDLGSVIVQNKIWRVFTTNTGVPNDIGGLFVFDQNGNQILAAPPITWDRNQSIALQATDIDTALTAVVGATTVTAGINFVDIEITSITGYDWGLQATTSNPGPPLITDTSLGPVITQEAYDSTLAGKLNDIGSYDLQSALYIWSTPQTNLPTVVQDAATGLDLVVTVTINVLLYRVTCAGNHNLTTGMKVVMSEITVTTPGVVSPNGTWIVTVISPTVFDLNEYYNVTTGMVATASTGKITLYSEGVGEVGVAVKDENIQKNLNPQWTYTRLLRTKEWNFRTKKQIHTYAEKNSLKDSLYWTDDFNPPRVMYYVLPYVVDGAITVINSTGQYAYDTVAEETKLLQSSTGSSIAFTTQEQSGGGVDSGNWRYAIRFLPDSLSPTDWTTVTNPVNVAVAATNGNPSLIIGDAPGTNTGKINKLLISGILPGLFKFVELAGINYVGGAVEGFVLKRVLLTGNNTTLEIAHTGTEANVTTLDLATLNVSSAPVVTAKSIDVIDKRMILTNITIAQQTDFNAWTQTFKHSILRKEIDSVRSAIDATLRLGEYQDPENVNMNMGLMHNETYRFSVRGRFKENGFWSGNFWIDDIKIDTLATNITTPNRRVAGLPDFALTRNQSTVSNSKVWVAYINFSDIDFDFEIDGVRIRDLFDIIEIERVEVVPEVLACGVSALGVNGVDFVNGVTSAGLGLFAIQSPNFDVGGDTDKFIEYPFISGNTFGVAPTGAPFVYPAGYTAKRKYAAFYSPDIWFGHTAIAYQASDEILNYGVPLNHAYNGPFSSASPQGFSSYAEWTGFHAITTGTIQTVALDGSIKLAKGESHTFSAPDTFFKTNEVHEVIGGFSVFTQQSSQGQLLLGAADFVNAVGSDRGFYYMQYNRPITYTDSDNNKYGNRGLSKYITCGHRLEITGALVGLQATDVFGGDTFTQLSYFRHRQVDTQYQGLGGAISFYSQNRVNAQMKQKSASQTGALYPGISAASWVTTPTDTDGTQGEAYQEGYTIRNDVQSHIAFDPTAERFDDLPVRIVWSEIKPQGSPADRYRIFLPLNFHDLDLSFGEIVHHANVNGELITWQPKKFQRQWFNTRGTLETAGVGPLIVGDGAVMSRDGVTISLYGSSHKWSIIKGKSKGGKDVMYWVDVILKKVIRFGYDGTVSIADIKGMRSFFANNLMWVVGKDNPADGQGIASVWHTRFSEAGWTVRGIRRASRAWSATDDFNTIGELISNNTPSSPFSTFEQTGELFLVKVASTSADPIEPVPTYSLPNTILTITGTTVLTVTTNQFHRLVDGDQVKFRGVTGMSEEINEILLNVTVTSPTIFTVTVGLLVNNYVGSSGSIVEVNSKYWTFIPHTDNNYFNEYTILLSEVKKGFVTFATYLPKIYLPWEDDFLTPAPVQDPQLNFEHNKGVLLRWYFPVNDGQFEKGFIEGVINKFKEQGKWFGPIAVNCDETPDGMTFETRKHKSFLTSAELELFEENYFSPIKGDSTATATNPSGRNDLNTSLLNGKYMKARFSFAVNTPQRLSNFVINFSLSRMLE